MAFLSASEAGLMQMLQHITGSACRTQGGSTSVPEFPPASFLRRPIEPSQPARFRRGSVIYIEKVSEGRF